MKGTTFNKWLAHVKRPRSRGDELILYALCVLYRRHCIVYTKWQPWFTPKPSQGQTLNNIEEMCETKLLFIGNELFGELHRLPLDRVLDTPSSLKDIQNGCVIDRDINTHTMHLTVIGVENQSSATRSNNSDSEPSTKPQSESTTIDIKPPMVCGENPFNVFSDVYTSYMAVPKVEPNIPIKAEAVEPLSGELPITNVWTLGTAVKTESTIITVDPHCVFHCENPTLLAMDTTQDSTITAPPCDPLQEATFSDQGNTLSKYYFCMSPGGTEVLYLHHDDIVRNKCTVQLDKLRPGDIPVAFKDISSSSINETTDKDSTQYGTKSDPDWNNRTKKEKVLQAQVQKDAFQIQNGFTMDNRGKQ